MRPIYYFQGCLRGRAVASSSASCAEGRWFESTPRYKVQWRSCHLEAKDSGFSALSQRFESAQEHNRSSERRQPLHIHRPVSQSVETASYKRKVVGSNPAGSTTKANSPPGWESSRLACRPTVVRRPNQGAVLPLLGGVSV